MKAYRYNPTTSLYEGEQERQLDPVATRRQGKEVFLMPASCTDVEPPEAKDGYNIVWDNSAWGYKEIEKEPEAPEYKETTEDKINALDSQYEQDKKTLQEYYVTFMIAGDTDGMESIKEELESLAVQYDTDLAELEAESEAE